MQKFFLHLPSIAQKLAKRSSGGCVAQNWLFCYNIAEKVGKFA